MTMDVDIYAVGALSDIQRIYRYLTMPVAPPYGRWMQSRLVFGRAVDYIGYQLRLRNFRAIRSYFNGYLAEPIPLPAGLRRCGSGWTQARALAKLERELRRTRVGLWIVPDLERD